MEDQVDIYINNPELILTIPKELATYDFCEKIHYTHYNTIKYIYELSPTIAIQILEKHSDHGFHIKYFDTLNYDIFNVYFPQQYDECEFNEYKEYILIRRVLDMG